jgi:hypothetical protein
MCPLGILVLGGEVVEEGVFGIRAERVLMSLIRTERVRMVRGACVPRKAARKSRREGANGPQ